MIIESLKREGRKTQPLKLPNTWIQFTNVIVDVETGKEFEATPEYFTTNPIPFSLGEKEETPVMDEVFKQWVEKNMFKHYMK